MNRIKRVLRVLFTAICIAMAVALGLIMIKLIDWPRVVANWPFIVAGAIAFLVGTYLIYKEEKGDRMNRIKFVLLTVICITMALVVMIGIILSIINWLQSLELEKWPYLIPFVVAGAIVFLVDACFSKYLSSTKLPSKVVEIVAIIGASIVGMIFFMATSFAIFAMEEWFAMDNLVKQKDIAVLPETKLSILHMDRNPDISFKKFEFADTSGSNDDIRISFTYPVAMPDSAALIELQKNFIKQAFSENETLIEETFNGSFGSTEYIEHKQGFGEKYTNLEPSEIIKSIAKEFRSDEPCSLPMRHELYISDSAHFPISGFSGFLQYTVSSYEYNCGAAHGNGHTTACVYNLADGKKVELKDIFNNGWEPDITKLIIKKFSQEKSSDSAKELEENYGYDAFIPSSERMELKRNGLVFFYPRYSIAGGAIGEPEIFLSWKNLKPYLNKKSVIYSKLQF